MTSLRGFKWALAMVLLLVFIAYMPCLRAGFVNWDDDIHVLNNFSMGLPLFSSLSKIWTTTVNYTYIPLTSTTWGIEHHFFGFNPFIFHLDNILLHLVVTAFVIIFSQRMGLSPAAAAMSGLLFGIHPIHVESVAWITERKDVLYASLFMAALLAYLKYLDCGRKEYFWLTLLLGELSICAKPMAISLPLVLLALDWYRGRQWSAQAIIEKAFCGAVLMPIAFITYVANSSLVQPAAGQGPFIWIYCFIFYLYKFLHPWPMLLFYGIEHSGRVFYTDMLLFLGFMIMLGIFRKERVFVFAAAFYFTNILLILRFHSILGFVSDRYMYLPSIGWCMLFAVLIEKAISWGQGQRVLGYGIKIALGLLILAMAYGTWRQCEVWLTSETLWKHQLKYDSKTTTWLDYCKLADAYLADEGHIAYNGPRFNRIRSLYLKSIHLNPDYPNPYLGLKALYERAGARHSL